MGFGLKPRKEIAGVTSLRRRLNRCLGVAVAAFLVLSSLLTAPAIAQDATPEAISCTAPAPVPAPFLADSFSIPPVASPAASPSASFAVTPIDPASADAIEDTVRQLAACLTEGNAQGVTDLVTARYLGSVYGGGRPLSPADYLVLAGSAPVIPVRILSVSSVSLDLPTTATATVESVAGNQLRLERWTFIYRTAQESQTTEALQEEPADSASGSVIEGGGTPVPAATAAPATPEDAARGQWLVQGVAALGATVPADVSDVEATITEYEIDLANASVAGPDIVVRAENSGSEAHELLVLRLDGEATTGNLLRPTGDAFPAGISVVGQILLAPGTSDELVLVDLEPGSYSVVCLLPDPTGVPHLALGEETTLTVQ